jgi:hypothetical protein
MYCDQSQYRIYVVCWLACFVHNGPPSPEFQILASQLRQRVDRAAGLSIKSLGPKPYGEDNREKGTGKGEDFLI